MALKRIGGIGLFKFQQVQEEKEAIKEAPDKVKSLGKELAGEKLKGMKQEGTIKSLGSQLAKSRLDNMKLEKEIQEIKEKLG